MVLHIVGSFVGLIKAKLHTNTDGTVFRLHYRWTTTFCFLSCALVSATEYIGNAIQCIGRGSDSAPKSVVTYCWIKATYTLDSYRANSTHYYARASDFSGTGDPDQHEIRYHNYYQWVPFILFFQGCLFYLPHLLWKTLEGKTADQLLQGLHFCPLDDEADKKKSNIVKYLKESRGFNTHYAITYLLCEALNLVNVIVQMVLLDTFLGGVFFEYGTKVLSPESSLWALSSTFPLKTKCDFHYYGPDGQIAREDYLCILPQNILNEKVFLVLWFWLITLATVTAVELVWRVAIIVSPILRVQLMEQRGKLTADPKLEKIIRYLPLGDYCLLNVLGDNLDAINFKEVLLAYSDSHDPAALHPNGDTSYRPYSNLEDVDGTHIMEARV